MDIQTCFFRKETSANPQGQLNSNSLAMFLTDPRHVNGGSSVGVWEVDTSVMFHPKKQMMAIFGGPRKTMVI